MFSSFAENIKPRFEMSNENKWYADLWIIKLLSLTLTIQTPIKLTSTLEGDLLIKITKVRFQ